MNILHITPHLGGGVGSVVLNWMKKDVSGYRHAIISLDKNNNRDWIEINKNCENVAIYDNFYNSNNFETSLRDLIRQNDIVLIHWWNHPLLYDVMVNRQWPESRIIAWNHTNSLFPPYSMPLKLFNFVDRIVFTSPVSYECPEIKKLTESQKEKISVIWSTAGVEDFENLEKIPHDGFNVGYVGTVDFGKLNRDFIKLCSHVNIPDVHFVVTSGDSQQHLINEAIEAGIWGKFRFLGRVPRIPHVPCILSEIDVFGYPLQPQNFATCEQALGEAMMAGCVPVVLANPTEKYIVKHMETGMIADSPEEYPRAIEYLYRNPSELKRLAENAKIFAKRQYDITQTIQQWNNVFDTIISIEKRTRTWDSKDSNKSPCMLYIESLGEYAEPLRQYISAQNEEQRKEAAGAIKLLFDSNSMFYSTNKGSVLQYTKFSPNDKILQAWAAMVCVVPCGKL
jgi:glycosyltransferase involved in cell wall biosynthesis